MKLVQYKADPENEILPVEYYPDALRLLFIKVNIIFQNINISSN